MKVSIPEGVIFETVDEQVVLLSLAGGTYYKLNGSGTRVWALIREHGDLERIEETMTREYEADPAVIRRDVATLVDDLKAHGLVEVDDATGD